MRVMKFLLPLVLAIIGAFISAQALASELTTWAVLLLLTSTVLAVTLLLRPLFAKRISGSQKRSGLPSKYERIQDPWRALSAGQDPTEQ